MRLNHRLRNKELSMLNINTIISLRQLPKILKWTAWGGGGTHAGLSK